MAAYKIVITRQAEKQLDKIDTTQVRQVLDAIQSLENDPRTHGCKKLKGREGYRIRAGMYRIIYDIFDSVLMIEVIAIGHRKDIYR